MPDKENLKQADMPNPREHGKGFEFEETAVAAIREEAILASQLDLLPLSREQMEDAFDLEKGPLQILEMIFPVPERGEYAHRIG